MRNLARDALSYLLHTIKLFPPPKTSFMNGKAPSRYTSILTERYRPHTKVRGRESPDDDDDIIATMVMVSVDSGSETRAESQNFPMIFEY